MNPARELKKIAVELEKLAAFQIEDLSNLLEQARKFRNNAEQGFYSTESAMMNDFKTLSENNEEYVRAGFITENQADEIAFILEEGRKQAVFLGEAGILEPIEKVDLITVTSMDYGRGASKATVEHLPKELLALAEKASKDYDTYGDKFEKEVWSIVQKKMPERRAKNLIESNFWVEGDKLYFDTGY